MILSAGVNYDMFFEIHKLSNMRVYIASVMNLTVFSRPNIRSVINSPQGVKNFVIWSHIKMIVVNVSVNVGLIVVRFFIELNSPFIIVWMSGY